MSLEHFNKVKNLIQEAEESGVLFKARKLTGFSGEKLIGALQRIAKFQESNGAGCYLEVGIFQGLSLISVASVLESTIAFGVDNFAHHDPKGINQKIVNKRAQLNNLENIRIVNADYEDALENLSDYIGDSKIGTYFIDGPHDYRSQFMCLQLIKPYLSDFSVIVVDDCNYRHVRLANRDFLVTNPEFKLLFESYTKCHQKNMDSASEEVARKGWWDGVNIIVHDKKNILNTMLPDTIRDRKLYENEHIVHATRHGYLAPSAVLFIQALKSVRLIRAFRQFITIVQESRKTNKELRGCYESMNTFSERLPQSKFNSIFK